MAVCAQPSLTAPENQSWLCLHIQRAPGTKDTQTHFVFLVCKQCIRGCECQKVKDTSQTSWLTEKHHKKKKKALLQKPFFIYAHLIKYTYRNYIKVSMNKHNFCFMDYPPKQTISRWSLCWTCIFLSLTQTDIHGLEDIDFCTFKDAPRCSSLVSRSLFPPITSQLFLRSSESYTCL